MNQWKRLAPMVLALAVLGGSGIASADINPVDTVMSLFSPTNVQAAGTGPTTVFVSWTDNSPIENANRIEMATDEAGPYTQVGVAPGCGGVDFNQPQNTKVTPTTCSYTISNLAPPSDPAPRFVRIVPLVVSDPRDPHSAPLIEGKASAPDPAILGPEPPVDLVCNGGGELACVNVTSVTLTWTSAGDQQEFWVMRGRGAANPNFGTQPIARLPGTRTAFHETLTEYSAIFSYRVVAVRIQNIPRLDGTVTTELSYSNSNTVVVETPPLPPSTDPSGLTAEFVPPSSALLTWTDRSPGGPYIDEDGWFIEMGAVATNFRSQLTRPASAGQGTVTYTDVNVPPDTKRCYRVRGYRLGPAFSGYAGPACIGSIPKAPTNLRATPISNAEVDLAWLDNSEAEDGFGIDRCNGVCTASSSGWHQIGDALADATAFADISTSGERVYSYRVVATNTSGRSKPTNIAVVTTPAARVARPEDLTAIATGSHEITLDWTDTATNETGYRVEYRAPAGEWTVLADGLSSNSHHYVDTESLDANERRCYRVRATRGRDERSDPSNEACATTFDPQPPNGDPSNITASPESNTSIVLGWRDNATNEASYRVEVIAFPHQACSTQNITGLQWTRVADAPAHGGTGQANFEVSKLVPHSAYFFRVRARNLDGESASSAATACTQTYGPALPVFKDPTSSGEVSATRCSFTIQQPTTGPDRAVELLVYVNAIVKGTELSDTKTIHALPPASGDQWVVKHNFRNGVNYRILATAYGPSTDADPQYKHWTSATAEVHDITVLADCPQSELPS